MHTFTDLPVELRNLILFEYLPRQNRKSRFARHKAFLSNQLNFPSSTVTLSFPGSAAYSFKASSHGATSHHFWFGSNLNVQWVFNLESKNFRHEYQARRRFCLWDKRESKWIKRVHF